MTWNNACRTALAKLFDDRLANPKHQHAHEIDPYFELDPAFAKYAGRVVLYRTGSRPGLSYIHNTSSLLVVLKVICSKDNNANRKDRRKPRCTDWEVPLERILLLDGRVETRKALHFGD